MGELDLTAISYLYSSDGGSVSFWAGAKTSGEESVGFWAGWKPFVDDPSIGCASILVPVRQNSRAAFRMDNIREPVS